MRKGLKYFTGIIAAFMSCPSVYADQILRVLHVDTVFAEGATGAGFYSLEGLPECQYGIMYINLGSDAGRAQFSMVVSAKASNWAIQRMDYTVSANGTCQLTGLHFK